MNQGADGFMIEFQFSEMPQAQISVRFQHGTDCHNAGDAGSDRGRNGSASDPESRESEVALNQTVVQKYVDDIGSHIDGHRDLCLTDAAHCRTDAQRPAVEHKGQGDGAEIDRRSLRCFRIGSGKLHQRYGAEISDQRDQNADAGNDGQRLLQTGNSRFRSAFPFSSRHNRSRSDAQRLCHQ